MPAFTSKPTKVTSHDVVLSRLNSTSKWFYQSVELMKGSEKEWEKVPLYFGVNHPEPLILRTGTEDEKSLHLKACGCRPINGRLEGVSIVQTGHPRMTAQWILEGEPELEKHIKDGILSLSIGYETDPGTEKIDELTWDLLPQPPVHPNHVLFFIEDKLNVPGDKGSGILNKASGAIEYIKKGIAALFKRAEEEENPESAPADPTPPAPPVETPPADPAPPIPPISQKAPPIAPPAPAEDPKVIEMKAVMLERDTEIASLKAKVAAFEQAEKDRKWEEFKASIPPGMIHGEKEKDVRQKWETNPGQVALDVLAIRETQKPTDPEGQKHVSTEGRTFVEDGVEYYKETIESPVMKEYKEMREKSLKANTPATPAI